MTDLVEKKGSRREVRLNAWAINNKIAEIGEQCFVTRDAIHKAISSKRKVHLIVATFVDKKTKKIDHGEYIVYAHEYKEPVAVFGFKSIGGNGNDE